MERGVREAIQKNRNVELYSRHMRNGYIINISRTSLYILMAKYPEKFINIQINSKGQRRNKRRYKGIVIEYVGSTNMKEKYYENEHLVAHGICNG